MSIFRLEDLLARLGVFDVEEVSLTPTNPDDWPHMGVAKLYPPLADRPFRQLRLWAAPTYYQDMVDSVLSAVPKSFLYAGLLHHDGEYQVLPYSTKNTAFWLEAEPGEPVELTVQADVSKAPNVVVAGEHVRIPGKTVSLVEIPLGLGENFITVRQGERTTSFLAYCTRLAGFVWTLARVMHDGAYRDASELIEDLRAPISSRLLEHTLPYVDLIPNIRALRIMGVRGSTAARILHSATEHGVRNMLAALVANTPSFQQVPVYSDEIDPADDPSYLLEQRFAQDVSVWLPHLGVVRREALIRLAVNLPQVYPLSAWGVREVVLAPEFSPEQPHFFEHPDAAFPLDDLLHRDCYEVLVSATNDRQVDLMLCGVAFEAHQVVDRCAGLGRRFLDCDNFDINVGLDFEVDYDPQSDGWENYPLTEDHLDPRACLGIQPARIPEENNCCWLWGPPMSAMLASLAESPTVTDASVEYLIEYLPDDPV